MIDEKKIEEAARKYAFNKYNSTDDEVEDTYMEELQIAFEAGINWFLDNLVYNFTKTSPYNKPCEVEDNKTEAFHRCPISYYDIPGCSLEIADCTDANGGIHCQLCVNNFLKE